jgi:hypothetical protein
VSHQYFLASSWFALVGGASNAPAPLVDGPVPYMAPDPLMTTGTVLIRIRASSSSDQLSM